METVTVQIEYIKEMLSRLSEKRLQEVSDFVAFLLEKEQKHKAFVERVLEAEKQPTIIYESVDDAVRAVFDEMED